MLKNINDNRVYSSLKIIVSVSLKNKILNITWSDGMESEFDEIWLHDHCRCEYCMHSITLEPLITLPEKSENEIETFSSDSKGIYINWADKHKSVFLNGWLRSHAKYTE